MKVSLVAAVYNDVRALELIVEALRTQTYTNFELVVAEDACSAEIATYLASVNDISIAHTVQEDLGIRKSRSINNAILKSQGEYLIFIDGDCLPYSTFIEGHVRLAAEGQVLSGRRVNLGSEISTDLRSGRISSRHLERHFVASVPRMLRDGTTHLEQGLRVSADGFIFRHILSRRTRNTSLLGCNFSCFRSDMFAINGFDESYEGTAVADDTDLQWRFIAKGMVINSCKNVANVFHLFHDSSHRIVDASRELALMLERKERGEYFCPRGLSSHAAQ